MSLGHFTSSVRRLSTFIVGVSLALNCAPDTNLLGQGGAADPTAPGPSTLSSAVLLEPSPGMIAVPLNLPAVTIGFPRLVQLPQAGGVLISLAEAKASAMVPLAPPAGVDCAGKMSSLCVRVSIDGALSPAADYVVTLVGMGLTDDLGHVLVMGRVGQFTTALAPDLTPPAIRTFSIELSGPCVIAHFETDEPVSARVVVRIDGAEREILAGTGPSPFSAAANLTGVPAGAQVQVFARAIDLVGNVGESSAVELPWANAPVPIAITELHANPLGPEPAQEFVELENVGSEPFDLGGLALEDEKGRDMLPTAVVGPGERVLVVPSGFDAASEKDTLPAPGTQLVRVDTRLGFDGLSNSGEMVRLRGRDGSLVSSYSVATPVSASAWAGKSVHRVPESGCDQKASWTQHPLPATPGWGPP